MTFITSFNYCFVKTNDFIVPLFCFKEKYDDINGFEYKSIKSCSSFEDPDDSYSPDDKNWKHGRKCLNAYKKKLHKFK